MKHEYVIDKLRDYKIIPFQNEGIFSAYHKGHKMTWEKEGDYVKKGLLLVQKKNKTKEEKDYCYSLKRAFYYLEIYDSWWGLG